MMKNTNSFHLTAGYLWVFHFLCLSSLYSQPQPTKRKVGCQPKADSLVGLRVKEERIEKENKRTTNGESLREQRPQTLELTLSLVWVFVSDSQLVVPERLAAKPGNNGQSPKLPKALLNRLFPNILSALGLETDVKCFGQLVAGEV